MRFSLKRLQKEARTVAHASGVTVQGMDFEDLTQEAMTVMWLALATQRVSTADPSRFLSTTGQNHLRQLARSARAARRCPQDVYGRPLHFVDVADISPAYHVEPHMPVEPPAASIPPCHVRGADPEGYDTKDTLCHNCPDKFSCLVETAVTGLTSAKLEDDPEVQLVASAKDDAAGITLAYEVVMERMRRRVRLRAAKEPIPAELNVQAVVVLPPAPAPRTPRQRIVGASLGAPAPAKPLPVPEKMPRPKNLTPSQLDQAMRRIKVGQPFPMEIGHVLVRKRQGAQPDVCVEIRENGFWLNLNQETYGSLSSAAKAAECLFGGSFAANRPGNAYFNIVRRFNTEIRDAATGAVLACRRGTR